MQRQMIACPFEGWSIKERCHDLFSTDGADLLIVRDAKGKQRLLFHKEYSSCCAEFSGMRAAGINDHEIRTMMRHRADDLFHLLQNQSELNHRNVMPVYTVTMSEISTDEVHVDALTDIPGIPKPGQDIADEMLCGCYSGLKLLIRDGFHAVTFSASNLQMHGNTLTVSSIGIAAHPVFPATDAYDACNEENLLLMVFAGALKDIYQEKDQIVQYLCDVQQRKIIPGSPDAFFSEIRKISAKDHASSSVPCKVHRETETKKPAARSKRTVKVKRRRLIMAGMSAASAVLAVCLLFVMTMFQTYKYQTRISQESTAISRYSSNQVSSQNTAEMDVHDFEVNLVGPAETGSEVISCRYGDIVELPKTWRDLPGHTLLRWEIINDDGTRTDVSRIDTGQFDQDQGFGTVYSVWQKKTSFMAAP